MRSPSSTSSRASSGVATATTLIVQGNQDEDLASIRGGAFVLLFAFTYLWVAFNGYLNAGGRAFGWVLPVCGRHRRRGWDLHLQGRRRARLDLAGDRLVRLGRPVVPFFVLLALDRPIGRVTGLLAIAEGIATSWVFGFLLLQAR